MDDVATGLGEESAADIAEDKIDNVTTLKRGFTMRSAFALSFSCISAIVSVFTIFSIALFLGGGGFWLALPIVLVGQLVVVFVFGDIASKIPLAGSVYQWSRYLVGPRYGWFTAWIYICGLTIALGTLSYGAAGFLLGMLNDAAPSHNEQALVAALLVIFCTGANIVGRSFLKWFFTLSVAVEVVCSLILGTILLAKYRVSPISVIFHSAGASHGSAFLTGPFLAAIAVVGWSFLGFEAAGSVGEEVEHPARAVPKAMVYSLVAVGIIILYSSLALTLAVPSIGAVISGQDLNPIATTLQTHLGTGAARGFQLLFCIGFLASFLAVQAAVTRCIWANARDRVLPAHKFFIKLNKRERIPYNAIIVTGVVAIALPFINSPKIYGMLINSTSAGFYLAYTLPVLGAAYVRAKGKWEAGPWTLGPWGTIVTYVASVWLIFETINVVWPRAELYGSGWLAWSVIYMMIAYLVVGLGIFLWVYRDGGRHVRHGDLQGIEDFDPIRS